MMFTPVNRSLCVICVYRGKHHADGASAATSSRATRRIPPRPRPDANPGSAVIPEGQGGHPGTGSPPTGPHKTQQYQCPECAPSHPGSEIPRRPEEPPAAPRIVRGEAIAMPRLMLLTPGTTAGQGETILPIALPTVGMTRIGNQSVTALAREDKAVTAPRNSARPRRRPIRG